MMKTTADLYSTQLTVKPHSTRGIGGDFAGILLSTLAAAICNTNVQNQAFLITQRRGSVATADRRGAHPCRILANKAARKTRRQKKWWKRGKHAEREIRTKCVCSMNALGNQSYSENIAVMFHKYFFI